MDDCIKFPTGYMSTEMAVFIVKHRLSYYENGKFTFKIMTNAIEIVARADLARLDLSNEDFQRALRWLFDHYDFDKKGGRNEIHTEILSRRKSWRH
jgi:hypothetical protein